MRRKIKLNILENLDFYFTLKRFSKVDLYGEKSVEKRSDNALLSNVSITSDGTHILPRGSTSSQFLGEDGKYIEKKDVEIFSEDGQNIELTPSMFRTGVELEEITFSDYFRYNFWMSYYLDVEDFSNFDFLYSECKRLFDNEKLYKFRYAYYDTPENRDAILIPIEENTKIIVVVGRYTPEIYNSLELNVQEISEIEEKDEIKFEDVW